MAPLSSQAVGRSRFFRPNILFLLAAFCLIYPSVAQAHHPILPDFHADPSARVFEGRPYVDSMAKTPLGPWEFKGHDYLFYHVQGPSNWERQVCVEPIFYNEDGTIRPVQMTLPASK